MGKPLQECTEQVWSPTYRKTTTLSENDVMVDVTIIYTLSNESALKRFIRLLRTDFAQIFKELKKTSDIDDCKSFEV